MWCQINVLEESAASTSLQVQEAGSSKTVLTIHQTAKCNIQEYMILFEIAGSTICVMVKYHNQEVHSPYYTELQKYYVLVLLIYMN
jgi:outer membrane lipopolysaccharide assembly protein LptE/RlpB